MKKSRKNHQCILRDSLPKRAGFGQTYEKSGETSRMTSIGNMKSHPPPSYLKYWSFIAIRPTMRSSCVPIGFGTAGNAF